MGQFDIMPLNPDWAKVKWGRVTAAQVFRIGEVVGLVNAGTISEMPIDETAVLTADAVHGAQIGIAAMSGDTAGTGGNVAATPYHNFANNTYPNAAPFGNATADDLVCYWPINAGITFITANYQSAVGTDAVPPATIIGEAYTLNYDTAAASLRWVVAAVNPTLATDVAFVVQSVLDVNKRPIATADTTGGVWITGEIVSHPYE